MKIKEIYIPVQLHKDLNREYVQKILQEKIGTKGALEIEDIIDIQDYDYNEDFGDHYIYGRREKAIELLDYIDPNHDEGYFFIIAARNGDIDMLTALIEKGKEKDPDNTINSIQEGLGTAAHKGYLDCVKLLIENGADPKELIGTTAYNNHQHIKEYLDKIIG